MSCACGVAASQLEVVHLQCHIGTDTVALARLDASMTGLHFSLPSLAERGANPARLVEADVYSALEVLPEEGFDLVYTGIGALCWLADIARWASAWPASCARAAGSFSGRRIPCSTPLTARTVTVW